MSIKNKYKIFILSTVCLLFFLGTVPAMAYDTAPRISDREIIESLTELKQGHKNLHQRIDHMNQSLNQRFDSMDKRFDEMTQNFNQRFEEMHSMILNLFTSVMALVIAMIGYMIWDRKTAQQPFKQQIDRLEN